MTYPRILAQIITKDIPIKIPDEIIHFYNNDYIHFPSWRERPAREHKV